jgi:hypothetical protein
MQKILIVDSLRKLAFIKWLTKRFVNICGLTHHPGECKHKKENKKPHNNNIDA